MATVDFRTRLEGDADLLDLTEFLEDRIPASPQVRGRQVGFAATRLGLVPLTLDVEGSELTLVPDDDGLQVRQGVDDALVVAMDRGGFSELMQDMASTFGLQMTGRAEVRRGTVDSFVEWEPLLRYLLDGRPGLRTRSRRIQ